MIRRFIVLSVLTTLLIGIPAGAVFGQGLASLDLPPGIEAQAQPLHEAMMQSMQESGMSHDQMQSHMAEMQTIVDQLPPGIFLQILELMPDLEMAEMMSLHQELLQEDGLLQQPPGQILRYVRELTQ
jgi:hypothetical protein